MFTSEDNTLILNDGSDAPTESGTTNEETVIDGTTESADTDTKNPLDPQVNKPHITGHRPWPDDSIRDGKMEKLYVLLVGINEYPTAPLDGCVKDVESIEKYLRNRYSEDRLHLVVLKDKEATYEAIRNGFRNHLRKAGPKDSVWFHFSGHGTEAFAPEEFMTIEPSGRDQNLVCYAKEDSKDRLLLADKELAVLLEEVATQDHLGRAKKSPHIVVSLDCCHSGSGTRDFALDTQVKTRNLDFIAGKTRSDIGSTLGIRPIEAYADGYYKKQLPGKLVVPAVRHVLLSACTNKQKAGDKAAGGVFTNGLIQALEAGQGKLSYSDLFMRTRATVSGIRKDQTPQFETINNFDPFSVFLEGVAGNDPKRYEVEFQETTKTWMVRCGAIHGLPTATDQDIKVEIQTLAPENRPVARAKVVGVGAQYSGLEFLKDEELKKLKTDSKYQAVIRYLPATAVSVWVHGEDAGVKALEKVWDASENILMSTARGDSELEVEVKDGAYTIRDLAHKRAVKTYDKVEKVIKAIGLMVQWDRTVDLKKPASKIKDWADFKLEVMDMSQTLTPYQGPEIKIYASADRYFSDPNSGGIGALFIPKLHVKHTKQKFYAYLLHLRSDYSIQSYEGPVPFDPVDHPGKTELELPLWTGQWVWGLSKDEDATTSYLKVLLTTEPLDYQQLLQSGIKEDPTRDFIMRINLFSVKNEWYTFTTKVEITRENPNFNESLIQLNNFSGKTAFTSGRRIGDSQDPASKLSLYEQNGFEMLRLNPSHQRRALEVLEIYPAASSSFEAELRYPVGNNEQVIAIAFDGKDCYQAGASAAGSRTLAVKLRPFVGSTAAEGSLIDNPFKAGDKQAESLFRNAKLAFFKKQADFDTEQLGLT